MPSPPEFQAALTKPVRLEPLLPDDPKDANPWMARKEIGEAGADSRGAGAGQAGDDHVALSAFALSLKGR